ncbi:MAG: F0F1 ATP synthase subunit delta [Verrucomicrobiales bacterium]
MKISKQARRDAKSLFRSTFVGGVMDEAKVRQAVQMVLAQKPRGYMALLEHFKHLLKLEQDRMAAKVETAIPASPELQQTISTSLAKLYGKGLNITFQQNESLVGGMRIRVGSDVYDGSLSARLKALEQSF